MTTKPSRSLGFRYIYEPIGWRLSKLLAKTPITGNQISIFIMFITLVAYYFISTEYIFTGLIILQFVLLLDTMDGTVARIKNQASQKGKFFEAVWHICIFALFYFALGVYSYKILNNPNYIIMGGLTATFILIIDVMFYRHDTTFNIKRAEEPKHTIIQYIVRWITCPSHVFNYALILAFFNLIHLMVIFYFIIYLLIIIYKVKIFVLTERGVNKNATNNR